VDAIEQFIYYVDKANKGRLLVDLLADKAFVSTLIFSRTKHGADKIQKSLSMAGISAKAIHGNKSQNARQEALEDFKRGKIRAMVATDIAARGIDVEQISHVINYDLPEVPETYVHRIGRTGRAGASGIAISFCDYDEKKNLTDIQMLIRSEIKVVEEHRYPMQIFHSTESKSQLRNYPSPDRVANWMSKAAAPGSAYSRPGGRSSGKSHYGRMPGRTKRGNI
jgi:ATP-dependent RNA helicase RhlE